jgi:hypothetical protein
VVMFDGMLLALADVEDTKLITQIETRRDEAWNDLLRDYPSMKPVIITQRYNYSTDYGNEGPGRLNY